MTTIRLDSVYEEKDGQISVYLTVLGTEQQVLKEMSLQVKSIATLKDELRPVLTEQDAKEARRLSLKEQAQVEITALQQELTLEKEKANGTNLDR